MRTNAELNVENVRWPWAAGAFVCGLLAVRYLSPLYLVFVAALLGSSGWAIFQSYRHRTAGARIASLGLGSMIPAVVAVVLQGVDSL